MEERGRGTHSLEPPQAAGGVAGTGRPTLSRARGQRPSPESGVTSSLAQAEAAGPGPSHPR